MEPLNQQERKKAFWKFLAFFIVSMLFIVGAVYFNFEIPEQREGVLRDKYELLSNEFKFQEEFGKKFKQVSITLDSINVEGQNDMYLSQKASNKLANMQEMVSNTDTLKQRVMYTNMIQVLLDLNRAKKKLRNLEVSPEVIKQYKQRIQEYKKALEDAKKRMRNYRQLLRSQ